MRTTGTNNANIQVRENLLNSLLEIMKEKPLSSIGVAELTKYAKVSRMSFYRNYESIEQILTDRIEEIVDEYREEDENLNQGAYLFGKRHIFHYLEFMERHSSFFDVLILYGMGELIMHAITEYLLDKWKCNPDNIVPVYKIQLFSGGIYNLYVYLVKNGHEMELDEIADMICDFFGRSNQKM